jgi:uncharacterized membrane protein YedE/YeeE
MKKFNVFVAGFCVSSAWVAAIEGNSWFCLLCCAMAGLNLWLSGEQHG